MTTKLGTAVLTLSGYLSFSAAFIRHNKTKTKKCRESDVESACWAFTFETPEINVQAMCKRRIYRVVASGSQQRAFARASHVALHTIRER